MSDKLQLTDPLTGYIVLGNNPNDKIPAVLRDTGERVELTVPFKDIRTVPGNWFVSSWDGPNGGLIFGNQIPDKMPHELLFECNERIFALVGCRVSGNTRAILSGFGTGTIIPTYVICGGRNNQYASINGLRTSCKDAVRWFRLPSIVCKPNLDDDGRCAAVDVSSRIIEPIEIEDILRIHPSFNVNSSLEKDTAVSKQRVDIETRTEDAVGWDFHLDIHQAIRDLLSISDWQSRECIDMTVMRTDDSVFGVDGEPLRDRWNPVVSYYPRIDRVNTENMLKPFLFDFSDVGSSGVANWLKLRKECSKGMTLLAYLARDHKHLALETLSMLTGTALECVGWYIVQKERQSKWIETLRDGSERPKGYKYMLKALVEEFGGDYPFIDSETWIALMRATYVGNKHADAQNTDLQTTFEVTWQGLLLLRMWVGVQLGASIVEMRNRLQTDEIGKRISNLLA